MLALLKRGLELAASILRKNVTVQLTITVYGVQGTVMSFIRCTVKWARSGKNRKTEVAGTTL